MSNGGTHRSVADRTKPVRLAPADVLGLGLLGIRTRKARAALSALGISIGIATMIIVMGIPASSQKALLVRLSALGTNMLQATANPGQNPPVVFPPESPDMVARIGPVTIASAVANTQTTVARSDRIDPDHDTGLAVLASRLNLLQAVNGTVRTGRFLDAATEKFPTTVLGAAAATRLGITALPPGGPGPQVYLGNRWFTVIGILAPVPLAPDIDHSVLVGWDAAKAQLGFDGNPTVIYVQSQESQIEAVRAVMPATIDPQQPGLVQVSRPSDALAAKRETQTAFSALFLGLAGVALLVGGSASPTPWSSRCWSDARRSDCAGPWAPTGGRSAASSSPSRWRCRGSVASPAPPSAPWRPSATPPPRAGRWSSRSRCCSAASAGRSWSAWWQASTPRSAPHD